MDNAPTNQLQYRMLEALQGWPTGRHVSALARSLDTDPHKIERNAQNLIDAGLAWRDSYGHIVLKEAQHG